jgi:hypothetical protein
MLHAASGHQTAAEAAQPAKLFRLVEPGAAESGGALPAERAAVMLAAADVHRPVDENVEAEA